MALVIFYVISLHTVANHSDDNHYHTAVNIINCKHVLLKLPLAAKCLHQVVMKPILHEEVAQRTLHEIPYDCQIPVKFQIIIVFLL